MGKGAYISRKIAAISLLTALSLVTFILEGLLPPMFIPGAKPGLANIFSLVALIMYSPVEAFAVVAIRTLLGSLFAGNISALIYSLTGGVVAMGISSILLYLVHPKVSVMAISVAAAVSHNVTQDIVFVFISGTPLMLGYMPYLILLGILSGAVVGGVTLLIFHGVPQNVFDKLLLRKTQD